jgi:2-polyprenyl-6-methoxyphenol hydroxylase-like FAD-dependent oxidoreductase
MRGYTETVFISTICDQWIVEKKNRRKVKPMNTKTTTDYDQLSEAAFGHAVVIGSGMAGLTTARVLTDHFAQVTLIERDRLPGTPQFRRGVPQAHHAHSLPIRGQALLEQQFPGLTNELVANGAVAINGSSEIAFFVAGEWHQLRHHAAIISISCSRPLLEGLLYRRVAAHPRVRVLQEHGVEGLMVDRRRKRVTGVQLRRRGGLSTQKTTMAADLIIDASGRDSQAPHWLADLGYTPPQETVVNAFAGYASRLYRSPVGFDERWKTLYIRPTPNSGTRGGVIIPIEGNRWHVTLIGMAGDYPPTSEAGFLGFAHNLPTPQLYEAISAAEPLTEPSGYRRTENRVRHYERLPRYLEGLLVCGDAAYTLNPVYAQGMTAAVIGSEALNKSLKMHRDQHGSGDLTGLAATFQKQLSRALADLWQIATNQDRRWPMVEVAEELDLAKRRQVTARIAQRSSKSRDGVLGPFLPYRNVSMAVKK